MAYFRISLAGDLGSGKSTVGAILKDRFYADIISVGKIQREMAEQLGMNTTEFNVYQESHPELDKKLDDMLAAYEGKEGSFIFDSRMAWHLFRAHSAFISNATLPRLPKECLTQSVTTKCILPARTR